jgi:hypothetical protein
VRHLDVQARAAVRDRLAVDGDLEAVEAVHER